MISQIEGFVQKLRSMALVIGVIGLASTLGIFIYGIAMRYLWGTPQTWTDEAVTILATWVVFWTGAFVLRWSEFISFDLVYSIVPPQVRRWLLLAGSSTFVLVFAWLIWEIIDFINFMAFFRTDMMRIRLDLVYSIFALFLIVMSVRLAWLCIRLLGPKWRQVVEELNTIAQDH